MPVRPDRGRSGYPDRGSRRPKTGKALRQVGHQEARRERHRIRRTVRPPLRPFESPIPGRRVHKRGAGSRVPGGRRGRRRAVAVDSIRGLRRLRTVDRGAREQDRTGRESTTRRAAVVERRCAPRQVEGPTPGRTQPKPLPEKIRVKWVNNRTEARAFIGFKHINGPFKWDALAKAKFAAAWFEDGGDVVTISRTLGDNHNTVRRLVNGWYALRQASDDGFDREDRSKARFAFSHLYTALTPRLRPGVPGSDARRPVRTAEARPGSCRKHRQPAQADVVALRPGAAG